MLSNQEIDTGSDWCGNSDESGDCAPAWNPEPTEDNAAPAAAPHAENDSCDDSEDDEVINAFTAMAGEPEEPEEPGVEYVNLEDIITSLGWIYIEGGSGEKCKAGPTKAEASETLYVCFQKTCFKAGLKHTGRKKWSFVKDSADHKKACQLVETEMKKPRRAPRKKIFVKNLLGKSLTLPYQANNTIGNLKKMMSTKDGQKREECYLKKLGGRKLDDSRTLSDYNVQPGDTLVEMGRLLGGARNAADIPIPDPPQDSNRR